MSEVRVASPSVSTVLQTTTATYHDDYALRRASSTMTAVAVDRIRDRIVAARAGRDSGPGPLRILSLGCGDGDLDVPLLGAIADLGRIDHTGVDVNGRSLAGFRTRLAALPTGPSGPDVTVELVAGDLEHVNDPAGYDVILLAHVLYYVADPVALVQRLRRDLLRTDGILLVVHSAREGVPAVMSEAGLTPFLAAEDVAEALTAAGEAVSVAVVPTELDVTEVLTGTESGRTLLGFLVEQDPATLTTAASERLLDAIRDRSTAQDGRHVMPELLGILEVRCDLAPRRSPPVTEPREDFATGTDPVLDYRLLAERFDWPARLRLGTRGADGRRAILDVGCGTGRWLRALTATWPDLRDDRSDRTYTAVDPATGAVEAATEAARAILEPHAVHRVPVERLAEEEAGRYDLLWAIHSLYAVRPDDVDGVVAGLRALLRSDGVAIVALPDTRSFYLRAGELALGRRLFTGAEDVTAALTRAGVPHRVTELAYTERIPAADDLALRRYLWEESIGNSYAPAGGTAGGASGGTGAASGTGPPEQPDAAWWRDLRRGDAFHFPQHLQVITFRGA